MQENDKRTPEDALSIREILDKAEESTKSGRMTSDTTDGGVTEFVFEEKAPTRGLVFEQEEKPTPSPKGAKGKRTQPAPMRAEFDVPSGFTSDKVQRDASHISQAETSYHVYVPVFTEASENYRMTGRTTLATPATEEVSRPSRRREEIKCPIVEVVAESSSAAPSVVSRATAELPEEELTDSEAESIVVHIDPTPTVDAPFVSPSVTPPLPEERTLEEEKEDIRRLLSTERPSSQTAEESEAPSSADPEPSVAPGRVFTDVSDRPEERPVLPDPEQADVPETPMPKKQKNHLSPFRAGTSRKQSRRDTEYSKYANATKLKNRFLDGLMALRVRLIALAALTLSLVLLGIAPMVGLDLRVLLKLYDYKGLLALFDLLLCVCALALSIPEMVKTCKHLFAKQVLYAVLPLASTVGILAYDIYMIFADITTYPLLGSLYALGLLAVVFAAYLEMSAMFSSFKLVSVKGVKHAVERVKTRELEEENIALDGAIDEYRSYTARMFKTSFVTDFFHRHRAVAVHGDLIVFLVGLLFGCSLVIGAIAAFLGDGLSDGITALAMTWIAATPIAAVLVRPLTYACAQRCCFLEDCAILGEAAMYEYADVDVVSFEDTEVFGRGDVALKRVLIYGDKSRLPGALRQMASLFMAVGGPLQTLFTDTLDRRPLPASRILMEEDGVCGETEGCRVHAGGAAYMTRLGYSIPDSHGQDNVGTTRALYLAENGVVYAKFTFRYAFSEEFSQLLPVFKEKGIVPLIYTRDPNVTNDLLLSLTTGEDSMRVMHVSTPASTDEATPYGSAGLVTLGDKTGAIHLILMAKAYAQFQKKMRYVFLGQAIGGLLLFGSLSFLPVSAVLPWMLVWQGVWCALTAILGAQTFSLRRKRKELIENEKELSHE